MTTTRRASSPEQQQQQQRNWFLDRFRHHLLWSLFVDAGQAMAHLQEPPDARQRQQQQRRRRQQQNNNNNNSIDDVPNSSRRSVTPFTRMMKWFSVIMGVLFGGVGVSLVRWVLSFHYYVSSSLAITIIHWTVLGLVVWAGPEYLPPLTPMNGCHDLTLRLVWMAVFALAVAVCRYSTSTSTTTVILTRPLLERAVWIISATWHFDQSDANYKETVVQAAEFLASREASSNRPITEQELSQINTAVLINYCRAGASIGILWAAFEVYSLTTFVWGLAILLGSQLAMYLFFAVMGKV